MIFLSMFLFFCSNLLIKLLIRCNCENNLRQIRLDVLDIPGAGVVVSTGALVVCSPIGVGVVSSPVGRAVVCSPAGEAVVCSPAGEAVVCSPEGGAVVGPPVGGTVVCSPAGEAVVCSPVGEAVVCSPAQFGAEIRRCYCIIENNTTFYSIQIRY